MRLNKKGMTLVELIISVALLSVVLSFLFKILLDVKYESDESGFAIANQVNRAEIIKEIQKDLIDVDGIKNISIDNDANKVTITLPDDTLKYVTIGADLKTLTYEDKKWTIKDTNYEFGEMEIIVMHSCYAKVTIPILNYYDDNVVVDDIEIFANYYNCF